MIATAAAPRRAAASFNLDFSSSQGKLTQNWRL
jgi:hypothetical protein